MRKNKKKTKSHEPSPWRIFNAKLFYMRSNVPLKSGNNFTYSKPVPSVKRVVYSTCSIHEAENENVVAGALQENEMFKLVKAIPSWERRGLSSFEERKWSFIQ